LAGRFAARIIWVTVDLLKPSFPAISSGDIPRAL
jgi:hypothetical protein